MSRPKHYAVDLDGTLARYDGWQGEDHVGEPIAEMVARARGWLAAGNPVSIFTARAYTATAIPPIQRWCEQHLGQVLPVTNVKETWFDEFWDDKAVAVLQNTGQVLGGPGAKPRRKL